MDMVKLQIEKVSTRKACLAPSLIKQLDIHEGDILSIKEPSTGKKVVALATKNHEIPESKVGIGGELIKSLGVDEGFTIELTPYREGLVPVREVELGIQPATSGGIRAEDRMLSIKKNEKELLQFLGDRVFTINSRFEWEKHDVIITIEDTKPELRIDDVARFGELEDFQYKWVGKEVKTFNGILFIDISGSMEREDMRCKGIDWAIDRMKQEFTDPEAQDFFREVQGKENLSRLNGSLLAALKYLVEKIGRGVGEKIAVILYTTESHIVEFGEGNKYFNSAQPTERVASKLLREAKNIRHGRTNLLDGLKKARKINKEFPINKMKMYVILTDGQVDHEKDCLNFFEEHIYPRGDIIVNTLGLGNDINEEFLSKVARNSGGQYHHVEDLKELVEKYSEYAMNLEIQGAKESIQSWRESRTQDQIIDEQMVESNASINKPRCSSCGSGLSYYEEEWYCHKCERYIRGVEEKNFPRCEGCGRYLSYFEDDDSWYCYECEIYVEI